MHALTSGTTNHESLNTLNMNITPTVTVAVEVAVAVAVSVAVVSHTHTQMLSLMRTCRQVFYGIKMLHRDLSLPPSLYFLCFLI